MFGRDKRRKNRKRDVAADAASEGAETGIEAAADGCLGCDIHLLFGLMLLAGVPLLLWST
jgi:hypothetical protein